MAAKCFIYTTFFTSVSTLVNDSPVLLLKANSKYLFNISNKPYHWDWWRLDMRDATYEIYAQN